MKKYIFFLMISSLAAASCKSKKATTASVATSTPATMTTRTEGNITGKVSHQYRATGCATVIVFNNEGTEMTLIPKDKLPAEFDVDMMEIKFNYHTLKMANPAGCNVGIPAEITEITKK
ncbi:MAG: hypothetical protein K0S44_2969 [Bacteroidetes bacterium]|jgi:hypothetical protein|nr:hypothetical protein [Bacteroidota bacterium]